MTVETATYISQLDATYPASGDAKSEGDNHLRLIKSAVKATFPNLTATPVTPTSAELNYVSGVTSAVQTQLDAKAPSTVTQSGTGAVARTVQAKSRDIVSVKDFGAVGNGVTDDTAEIQAALNSVPYGGAVILPRGSYVITALTVPDGVSLVGESPYSSSLSVSAATGNVVTLGVSSKLRSLKIASGVTRTADFYVSMTGNGCSVDECEFVGYYIAINAGVIGGALIVNPCVRNCSFYTPAVATGGGAIIFANFSNALVDNCVITGTTIATTQPDFGIRYRNGDTAFLSNTNITTHGVALYIDSPAASNLYALSISNSIFDSAGVSSASANMSSASIFPAGGVYNTKISNCWFGLSSAASGCYIGTTGAGVVDGICFTGCEFVDNGDCGLIAVGAGVKNWQVTGGAAGGNTNIGIRAANATSNFCIVANMLGNISGRGANNYGLVVDSGGSNNYIISGNNVIGNTTGGLVDGGTGTSARVSDNLGYNAVANVIGLTVGASPWSYTAGHTSEVVYVVGGTLSELRIDGQIVQNTTNSTLYLAPNETMSITYTGLPTVSTKRL